MNLLRHTSKLFLLCITSLIPSYPLLAIPKAIRQIVQTFEGDNKKKKCLNMATKKQSYTSKEPQEEISNKGLARLAIDKAIKDEKLTKHPATWYYKGVIYDRLLRDHIASSEASDLLTETLTAYTQTTKLASFKTQFHSFSLTNITELWNYYLGKGILYYKQGSFDQALHYFTICNRILPKDPTPLLYSAIVYQTNKKPEEALRHYKFYLQKTTDQVAIYRAMADIQYSQLNNIEEAIYLLNTALAKFPFENELLEEKILIYKSYDKIKEYEDTLLEAIIDSKKTLTKNHKQPTELEQIGPNHFLYEYAYFLEHQERTEEAIVYYKYILKNKPSHHNTLRQLSFLYYNEAIKTAAMLQNLAIQQGRSVSSEIANFMPLTGVTVKYKFLHPLGFQLDELIDKCSFCLITKKEYLENKSFFYSSKFSIYNQTHTQWTYTGSFPISDFIKTGNLSHTSLLYKYSTEKIANQLLCNKIHQTIVKLEKQIKKALYYLYITRIQYKKDKKIAQALYYSYYHLKKYRSANKLRWIMQRKNQYVYQSDNPFLVELGEKRKDL